MNDSTTKHSWYKLPVHIPRSVSGKILRATCNKLYVYENGIGIEVNFMENGRKRHKIVSPIYLSSVHMSWLHHDIVSDDDDSGEESTNTPLPLLTVGDQHIAMMDMIKWTLFHTTQILQIV